jgi:putative nucleotidyltransferase with HDIG domain
MADLADRNCAATTTAIVLAAGFSSRMGAFKPLLPFGGRTLVDHVVANLRAAGVGRIHVVTGFQADALAPELTRLGVTRAHNPDFAAGMFSSVRTGVASLPADVDAFLLAPVDVPLLRASTIARVLRAATTRASTIVYPTFRGKRGHPPLVGRALFAEILDSDGDGGLRALLARHEDAASEVAVFDWGCLVDMDRRDDYRLLAAALAGHRTPDVAECETMFDAASTPEATRRHGRAVAALAASLARRLQAAGEAIDPDLARAAALVHDIAKGRRRHAEAGAALLREFGFPEIATPVARHMNFSFGAGRLDESAVVYLADKLVQGETRVTLETRFAPGMERFAGDLSALAGVRRRLAGAQAIAKAIEARIGPLETGDETALGQPAGGDSWPAAIAV